jgi:hypothetical protein
MFVIEFEPSDEQICALILHIAGKGLKGVPPDQATMVALFVIEECKRLGIRPSVRLYVDKAIPDYRLFAANRCETHWRDLIRSNIEQQLVGLQHPTKDLSRAERIEMERRIALDIFLSGKTPQERFAAWQKRTGKSQPALYRRLDELRKSGRLPDAVAAKAEHN